MRKPTELDEAMMLETHYNYLILMINFYTTLFPRLDLKIYCSRVEHRMLEFLY